MSASILAQRERSGPYRLTPNRLQALLDEAQALDLAITRITPASASTSGEWLAALGATLGFPAHFGANFDALYDCLCDREILPQASLVLLIDSIAGLGEAGSDTLIAVLQAAADEWRDQGRQLWSLFAVNGLDLDPLPSK